MLANVLNNISVYWVADGKKLAQVALVHGGNDLVGTAFSEEVYRAAGKNNQLIINGSCKFGQRNKEKASTA